MSSIYKGDQGDTDTRFHSRRQATSRWRNSHHVVTAPSQHGNQWGADPGMFTGVGEIIFFFKAVVPGRPHSQAPCLCKNKRARVAPPNCRCWYFQTPSVVHCICVCAVTKISTKFLPPNNFCQLLRVTRKRSCTSAGNLRSHQNFNEIFTPKQFLPTSAGNAQAQLHFRDDQQRAFGISNISNSALHTTWGSWWIHECNLWQNV